MVAILLITHGNVGKALLDSAHTILGHIDSPIETLSMSFTTRPEKMLEQAEQKICQVDQGDGVLILTDLFGATPCNITKFLTHTSIRTVSGLNISMLLRTLNYADKPLDELVEIAVQGGHVGITCSQRDIHAHPSYQYH